MTSQLSFHSKTLTPVIQDNQTWLTSKDLAKALGYKDTRSVSKIFNRNEDEFSACMTLVVNLTPSSKKPDPKDDTRIFSLSGCHLIAMFSRTKVAKEFRQWALNILDKEIGQPKPEPIANAYESKCGFSRSVMVFRHGQLIETYPLKNDQALVSFESPKMLQEIIKHNMPGYALVNKADLIKTFGL